MDGYSIVGELDEHRETITITIPADQALTYRCALSGASADLTLSNASGLAVDAYHAALNDLWQQIHDAQEGN